MKILYFSWIREKIGTSSEEIPFSKNISNINELINALKKISDNHRKAFTDKKSIRVAINKSFASFESKIHPEDEIAFFPPVTGG